MNSHDSMCLIILDRETASEREAVQELVAEHADGWWHRFVHVWFAGGQTPSFWRNLLKPVLTSPGSGILVLSLPAEEGDRLWAYFGPRSDERCEWIHNNYA